MGRCRWQMLSVWVVVGDSGAQVVTPWARPCQRLWGALALRAVGVYTGVTLAGVEERWGLGMGLGMGRALSPPKPGLEMNSCET